MKKAFGNIHYCTRFLARVMSNSARATSEGVTAFQIASRLLTELDALQMKNPLVTLSFATDSLRVYFRGQLQFHIQARSCRTIIWIPRAFSRDLRHQVQGHPDLFPVEGEHISWVFTEAGVVWLMDFLCSNWEPHRDGKSAVAVRHSRFIPGEVRQAVLTEFLTSGRWCSGVAGSIRRHKVDEGQRIEFDHILPHSLGGENCYWNVQILCSECNQLKRATAT